MKCPAMPRLGFFCVQCYLETQSFVEVVGKDKQEKPACEKHENPPSNAA